MSGDCAAGYACFSGSEDDIPNDSLPDPVTAGCLPNEPCAGPCPAGSYCLQGAENPTPCPEHTIRSTPGARMLNDCLPCSAGSYCPLGKNDLNKRWHNWNSLIVMVVTMNIQSCSNTHNKLLRS